MSPENIRDRKRERPRLAEALRQQKANNDNGTLATAVIVYSGQGIGKTTLIQAAAKDADVITLSVKTPLQAQESVLPPGAYFESIVQSFQHAYPNFKFKPKKTDDRRTVFPSRDRGTYGNADSRHII